MKKYIVWFVVISAFGFKALSAQSNLLENGSFEAIWGVGHYPHDGENLFDRCPLSWMDYNPGDDERWYTDSIWAGNQNLPDPLFQHGYYKVVFDNISAPWEEGVPTNPKVLQEAHSGNAYVGMNLRSDLFTREGIQQEFSQNCGLNSGDYTASVWWARPYPDVENHFWLALSDQSSNRRKVIDDLLVGGQLVLPGQWNFFTTNFNLDLNDPQDMGNRWFSISGLTTVNSGYGRYMYFDDVRLYRPCDEALECSPTHGQICPSYAFPQAPGDLMRISNISNASDLHLKIYASNGQLIKDTLYHNANGLPDFRFTRLALPISTAAAIYQYDLEFTNTCGGVKKTGNIQVLDTAAYNPITPYLDATASWTGVPIPCCLNFLTLQNMQIVGDVSFVVRDQITVQGGVTIAPNSHVTLQAGQVTELVNVDFDGTNSSLEIVEVPCPQRCAQGLDCGGGSMVMDAGQFVIPPQIDTVNPVAIKASSAHIKPVDAANTAIASETQITAYPNPFDKAFQISFDLPAPTNCTIVVRDLQMRPLRTLMQDKAMSAGSHQQTVDLAGLPAGVYVIQLIANGRSYQQRIVKQ